MEEQNKVTQRWSKTAVTDIGTAMLAEFAAGRILEITAAYGSAGTGGNLTELAELPDGRAHPLTIESVTRRAAGAGRTGRRNVGRQAADGD